MKLFNYNSIILAATLSLTGCIYGDLDKRARMDIYGNVVEYCESNHYAFCEVYAQCYLDNFNQLYVNQGLLSATLSSVLKFSPLDYSIMNAKDTMDALYSKLKDKEKINREDISLDISYLLYSHNQCSSIIGAKQYDISHYYPKIEESIERKRKKMNKK
ncbi:hypothetical protein [Gilliamella sp. WF3-4]|uniref:hypothetical protein n=1 Tax=Gilliamella sp. WF3-4 TaxID=3120255 RepID=UPI00080E59E2|nr:hypothetical protein [Gilliamella apicola]OCG19597.1 hypothetical protein A9G47_00345 [Gilliamella apicola]